jgi:hypothetical protein
VNATQEQSPLRSKSQAHFASVDGPTPATTASIAVTATAVSGEVSVYNPPCAVSVVAGSQ